LEMNHHQQKKKGGRGGGVQKKLTPYVGEIFANGRKKLKVISMGIGKRKKKGRSPTKVWVLKHQMKGFDCIGISWKTRGDNRGAIKERFVSTEREKREIMAKKVKKRESMGGALVRTRTFT